MTSFGPRLLIESCDDRFGSREDSSKSYDDVEQSSHDLEKLSHDLEQAAAVLAVFSHGRFDFAAVIERSFHVVLHSFSPSSESQESMLESRASRKLSFDVRRSQPAVMGKSFGGLCGAEACRLPLEASVR
jgi:hypothetical protein